MSTISTSLSPVDSLNALCSLLSSKTMMLPSAWCRTLHTSKHTRRARWTRGQKRGMGGGCCRDVCTWQKCTRPHRSPLSVRIDRDAPWAFATFKRRELAALFRISTRYSAQLRRGPHPATLQNIVPVGPTLAQEHRLDNLRHDERSISLVALQTRDQRLSKSFSSLL